MSILVKFRKIIFILSFLGLIGSGFFSEGPVNQSQYIWGSRIIQQASTTNGVDLGLADWFVKLLWSNIYTMDRATDWRA